MNHCKRSIYAPLVCDAFAKLQAYAVSKRNTQYRRKTIEVVHCKNISEKFLALWIRTKYFHKRLYSLETRYFSRKTNSAFSAWQYYVEYSKNKRQQNQAAIVAVQAVFDAKARLRAIAFKCIARWKNPLFEKVICRWQKVSHVQTPL